ncbi:MAG: ATP-binding cassette domain-containing protein [Phycisphaerae bacterium]|nr:ATP-binding cassette domain-containing protein [Phycisphaerae bacterium]
MVDTTKTGRRLGNFRRVLGYLGPHRRPLILGLLAAVGVGVFYTGSISSIIPALKMIFADHETLAVWMHRTEVERRLDVTMPADVPDDDAGILLVRVPPESPNAKKLQDGDRIEAVGGEAGGSFRLAELLATSQNTSAELTIKSARGATRTDTVTLEPYRWWWGWFRGIADILPIGHEPNDRLVTLAIVMVAIVGVSLLGSICRYFNEALVAVAVQNSLHDLRGAMADRVLRLPVPWHSTHPVGDTLGRFANDLNKVDVGVTTLFGKTIREPIKALGVLVLTVIIDWRILVVALVGLPIAAVLLRTVGRYVRGAQRRASESWGLLLEHLDERLAGIRVVKAYNMESAESDRFAGEGRALTRAQTNIAVADAIVKPALETLAIVAISVFILYGGSRVFNKRLEPHMFFAAVVCLAGMFDPVRKLGNVNNRVQAAEAAAARIFELIDTPAETSADGDQKLPPLPPFGDKIEFNDVCFAYASDREHNVIDHVNLTVKKGQVIALVGPNGAGKTTLVSLLLRFFEPTSGMIRIDGHNITDVSLHSLRAQFGLVTQDAIIFSGTVRDNIVYGSNGVTDEALRQAARLAHLDEFLGDLSRERDGQRGIGFDATISAKQVSGGQRQRIALARAILRDPPIMVLDEATSQVDSESEHKIQQALADVTRGRTTFIIAHRFSTIARADRIVVMENGRLVGVGRHAELSETCPVYSALCRTQLAPAANAPA